MKKNLICFSMSAVLLFSGVFMGSQYAAGAPKVKKIVMNKTVLNMKSGESFKLRVKNIKPVNLGKSVKYKSEKKKIATVNAKGVVKAKSIGTTEIIITSKKDKSVKVKVKVKRDKNIDNKNFNTTPAPENLNAATSVKPTEKLSPTASAKPTEKPSPTASAKPTETPAPPVHTPDKDDGRVFNNIPEMYADIISEQFKNMIHEKNGDIIALDLKDCASLSDSDRQALMNIVSEKYGRETVIKTREELIEDGKIIDDSMSGSVFVGGVLITIKDNKAETPDFTFDINCFETGLKAMFFSECKAVQKDSGWKYELGKKGLS